MSEIALEQFPPLNIPPDKTKPAEGKKISKTDFDAIPYHRPTISRWRLVVILACLSMGLFLALLDTAIVSTALYTISGEFGNFRYSSWVILSYTLADVGCAVMIARLADSIGRKRVIITSFLLFAIFSLACGWSKSMTQLIVFRACQGLGGAGLYSMTLIVFPEISPPKLMPVVSSIIGAVVVVSGIVGPVLGGALTTNSSWRWIFWLNGPCAIVPMIIIAFVWPKNFHSRTAGSPSLKRLDFVGGVLMLSGSVLLVFMLFQGAARTYSWNSAPAIVTFAIAGCSWIGLFAWEWVLTRSNRLASITPHFPLRLLKDNVMVAGFISTFLTGFVFLLAIVNIPLRAQIVDNASAVKAGIQLLPMVGGAAVGSGIGGGASAKKNVTYITLNIASALMILGCGLLSGLPSNGQQTKAILGYEFLVGLGVGISLSSISLVTAMQCQLIDHAVAQGIIAQLRIFGGSVGIAASTIILNDDVASTLSSILSPEKLADFFNSPISIQNFTLMEQLSVRETFITTFSKDMRLCMYISVFCLVATLCGYQKNPPTMQSRMDEMEAAYMRTENMVVGEA